MSERRPGRGMGRKNVALVQATQGVTSPQDAIWQAVRVLRTGFTRADVCRKCQQIMGTGVNDDTVRSYLNRLEAGGFLEIIDRLNRARNGKPLNGSARQKVFQLVKDTGVDTPRLTAKGEPVTQGRNRENMWLAIRILGEFDAKELQMTATNDQVQVTLADARDYIKQLHAVGYLHMTTKHRGSRAMARYRLLPTMNTGPKPPQVQRIKVVFDPNTGKTHARKTEEGASR